LIIWSPNCFWSSSPWALLRGTDREILVPDARQRNALWTPHVWPGAVLVEGEIVGTWRRAAEHVTIIAWKRLSRTAREAIEAEALALLLPDVRGRVVVHSDSQSSATSPDQRDPKGHVHERESCRVAARSASRED
jgi:hypothetical protein